MRSAAVLTVLGATLAIASPLHQAMHKRVIVSELVTDIVYVTVTAGNLPASTPEPDTTVVVKQTTYSAKPTVAPSPPPPPPPPPPPATTYAPVVAPKPVVAPVVAPAPVKVAPAPKVAPPAALPTDYVSAALYHHKMHRANHTASALDWDTTLATYAQTIANKCVFAHDMNQGVGGYGQNLAAYGTTEDTGSLDLSSVVADAITNSWYYGEAANMPYGQDSPAIDGVPEFLHFSQVLWKSTSHVGCATASCAPGTIFSYHSLFTVCNYGSTGNVLGSFSSEVAQPIGLAGISATIA